MAQFDYPVILEPDDGTVLVRFVDFPDAVTFGEDEADALARAVDALETAIIARISDREDLPLPSSAAGRPTVSLPPISAAKAGLWQAMRAAGLRKVDLGRRLGWHMPQIDRLLDLRHASRIDQIAAALRVLDKDIVVEIRDSIQNRQNAAV
jgi:antitoxin HicB